MIMYVCPSLRRRNAHVIAWMVCPFSKPFPMKIQFSLLFWLRN